METWQKAAPYCGNRTGPPRGGSPPPNIWTIFLQIPRPVSLFISLLAWLNLNLLPVGGWGGQIGQIPETTFSNLTFTIQATLQPFY